MNRTYILHALAAIFAALTIVMAPAMAANPAFNQAIADYKAGKYGPAASTLESLKTSYPSGGLTRYYLALCRQALGQYAKAKEEYEWVATNGDAGIRGMAQQGIQRLSGSATGKSQAVGRVSKIYDFNATWCGPCKRFAPIFESTKSKFSNVSFEAVDVDRNPKLADKYKVSMLPHLVFLDARGYVLYSGDAFRDEESFAAEIKKYH